MTPSNPQRPRRHIEQLHALFDLRDVLQVAESFDAMYDAAFDAMERILGADRTSIQLFDESWGTRFIAQRGLSPEYVRVIESRWTSIFDPERPDTFVSEAIADDSRESLSPEIVKEGIRSLVSIPLVAQGQLMGKFVVYCSVERPFSAEEIGFAETIANNVAFAIARKRSEDELRAYAERLDVALRASRMGTWDWDPSTDELTLDSHTRELWGIDAARFEGTREALLALVHDEDREAMREAMRLCVQDRQDLRFVCRIRWSDGSTREIDLRGRCFYDDRGQPIRVSGVGHDVTEQREAQRERARLHARLQESQRLESLGALAGGVAHDFNNLLVGILGNLGVVGAAVPEGTRAGEAVGTIRIAAERAASLARQMLAYSGRGKLRVEAVDLSSIVGEMAQLLSSSMSAGVRLEPDLAESLPAVRGDPTQLGQVVMNLITNAADAIGEGPGSIRLRTGERHVAADELRDIPHGEAMKPGPHVYVEVEDDGCGMDEAVKRRIFDPFFTTKFTGRGLGLGAVLGMIRSHQGGIRVDSQVGVGTTFTVLLPVSAAATTTVAHEASPPEPAPQPHGGGGKVLVVDDDPLVRHVMTAALQDAGYQVVGAEGGKAALERFRAQRGEIGVAVVDVVMPDMSGLELLRELRALEARLPVILCSGYADVDIERRVSDTGRVDVLQKPFEPDVLLTKIQSNLEDRHG